MKSLISFNYVSFSNPRISPSSFLFHFPSMSRENPRLPNFCRRRCLHTVKKVKLCPPRASSASELASYGGWDDLGQISDVASHGESDRLRSLLVSVGVDDKKHVVMFLLGLLCAFSISRIRVSSIVVFPASVLLFAIGFSFGFVRGGSFSEVITAKRRSKEEGIRISPEKLCGLIDFFDGFDVNVSNFKNDVQRAIDTSIITVSDLENYVNAMENVRLSALDARNVVQASTDNLGNSNSVLEDQKPSRRKKEPVDRGFDILQFVGSLFREKSAGLKYDRVKENNIKQATLRSPTNDKTRENISSPSTREQVFDRLLTDNEGDAISSFLQDSSHQSYSYNSRRIRMDLEEGRTNSEVLGDSAKRYIDNDEDNFLNNSRNFVNNRHVSLKMHHSNETRAWEAHGNLLDSIDLHTETRASFLQEQSLRNSSQNYKSSSSKKKIENRIYGSRVRKTYRDELNLLSHLPAHNGEINLPSSSEFANDEVFNRYLTGANNLLKEAKELIRGRYNEEQAEMILRKSAQLLSKAIALKPMSLLAVGQLGNTYLLHGELKLHVTRELRAILSKNDATFSDENRKIISRQDHQFESRDEIASVLINVCEECEELLVEAGRKYKLALSIDRNDVRALYNWGLALSFRAQLISDIGPEAAVDADKVFMAAIDKFDAMMSKGNNYAPDALFRWGVALQQRSRLRPSNSKEKVKLLEQAKRLYEDALHMDSENFQVREALSSCISELDYRIF